MTRGAAIQVIKGGKTVRKVDVNEVLEGLEEQIKVRVAKFVVTYRKSANHM